MLLGIDIGGTAIKAGAVRGDGHVLLRKQIAFDRTLSFDAQIAALAELADALQTEAGEEASAIGVCLPGFVDRPTGMLVDGGANVSALREKPLAKYLSMATRLPVHIENDGVAATVGEACFGAGRGLRRFMLLTIGTGVGGAVFIDGSVITGSRGEPPEIGAIMLRDDDDTAESFEKLACAAAFLERYRRHSGKEIGSLPDLFEALDRDEAAARTVEEICRIIARVFAPLINALNLEACIVGGGVAAAGEALLKPIRAYLPSLTWLMLSRNNQVLQAVCGNDAGLLGAAWLAQNSAKVRDAAQ
jgi:glucokinase